MRLILALEEKKKEWQESYLRHRAILSEDRYITACMALSSCDTNKQRIF